MKTGWVNGEQGTELNLSEQTQPINETFTQASKNIKVTQTYWDKTIVLNDFNISKYYELFINNKGNNQTYWISSRCVIAGTNDAYFYVHRVYSGNIDARRICDAYVNESSDSYAYRPVVTLNSNVQIDTTNTGDGSTEEQAYAIK